MSTDLVEKETKTPELVFDQDIWLNLEVPADIIDEQWEDDYEDELKERAGSQTILRNELKIAWMQNNEETDKNKPPREKTELLSEIKEDDVELAKCIYAAYRFSRGISKSYFSEFYKEISEEVEDTDYEELYNELGGKGRKVGKTLLLYLFNPDSLKSILVLDECHRPKPRAIRQAGLAPDDPIDQLNVGKILKQLESDSREYAEWHNFEYEGKSYLAIKRHLRDQVGRQVDENKEIEEAEFIVIKFRKDYAEVFAQKKTTANRAQKGLNKAFSDEDEIEYEPIEDSVAYDHFENTESKVRSLDESSNLSVSGIVVENSPLPHSPHLELQADDGIMAAIDELKQKGIDLLEQMDGISQIRVEFGGKKHTLYPSLKETSGEDKWRLRYNVSSADDETREEFEEEVEDLLGLRPIFEPSD